MLLLGEIIMADLTFFSAQHKEVESTVLKMEQDILERRYQDAVVKLQDLEQGIATYSKAVDHFYELLIAYRSELTAIKSKHVKSVTPEQEARLAQVVTNIKFMQAAIKEHSPLLKVERYQDKLAELKSKLEQGQTRFSMR